MYLSATIQLPAGETLKKYSSEVTSGATMTTKLT